MYFNQSQSIEMVYLDSVENPGQSSEFHLHRKVRIEHERNPCAEERPKLRLISSMHAQTYEDEGMQGP